MASSVEVEEVLVSRAVESSQELFGFGKYYLAGSDRDVLSFCKYEAIGLATQLVAMFYNDYRHSDQMNDYCRYKKVTIAPFYEVRTRASSGRVIDGYRQVFSLLLAITYTHRQLKGESCLPSVAVVENLRMSFEVNGDPVTGALVALLDHDGEPEPECEISRHVFARYHDIAARLRMGVDERALSAFAHWLCEKACLERITAHSELGMRILQNFYPRAA